MFRNDLKDSGDIRTYGTTIATLRGPWFDDPSATPRWVSLRRVKRPEEKLRALCPAKDPGHAVIGAGHSDTSFSALNNISSNDGSSILSAELLER